MNTNTRREGLAALTLGAIGVVYGDIGTSPLYTMKEVFNPANGVPLDAPSLIGAVSVIFWALMMVVTLKYVILILRADNKGEGGIMALTALAAGSVPAKWRTASAAPNPSNMPIAPPARQSTSASIRNCIRMSRFLAPSALRTPISRVRSVTETSMMFMIPIPPTSSETSAIPASR